MTEVAATIHRCLNRNFLGVNGVCCRFLAEACVHFRLGFLDSHI